MNQNKRLGMLSLNCLSVPAHLILLTATVLFSGCTRAAVNPQSPDDEYGILENKVRLVSDFASPFGTHSVKIEGIALVTGLPGTGSDPPPSVLKQSLLNEMRTRKVNKPAKWLASDKTAMVQVIGFLPPGIQKGDRFDLYVKSPSRTDTTSLRGGLMLQTRLSEMAIAGSRLRSGKLLALAEGPILVDPLANEEKNATLLKQGIVLGGGVARKSREFGLILREDHRSAHNSARVANSINQRFHTIGQVMRTGVAKAKNDKFIELKLFPRYEQNVARYIQVVRSIAVAESDQERTIRMQLLDRQLHDPVTSALAALKLEAIGRQAITILKKGLQSSSPEVQFYSAEALAYLDEAEAVGVLAAAAKQEPAFRAFALTALSAMNDVNAIRELADLMQVASAETRYGAFRAFWSMNKNDGLVRGEQIGGILRKGKRFGGFSFHVIDSKATPMIHLTTNTRAELVLFGKDQKFRTPFSVEAGKRIMVSSNPDGTITISRFSISQPEKILTVPNQVERVVRAIAELGGTYPDIVQALHEAEKSSVLISRLAINALPRYDRRYRRKSPTDASTGSQPDQSFKVASPMANMFDNRANDSSIQQAKNEDL